MSGKFKPGQSGNPNGRPKGVVNKTTKVTKKILDGKAKEITQKLIEMALEGDPVAIRLCMERIYPKPKDISIKATLPKINKVADIPKAIGKIFKMVGDGKLTINQGKNLTSIISTQNNILEIAELEKRISALEEKK